jgi:beta-aspartyl-peptidase (threonine type)
MLLFVPVVVLLCQTAVSWAGWSWSTPFRPHSPTFVCDPAVPVPRDGAAFPAGPVPPGDDRAAIHQVLDTQVAAWNRGDLEGFMAGYWSTPLLTFFSGKDKTAGWQATFERYRQRYQAEGQEMGQLHFEEIAIEVLGSDAAFVRGRWQLERKKDRPGGLFTLIFRKTADGWRIVHDHTSS